MMKDWASFGYPPSTLLPVGMVEIACALLYGIPRTSVLGAVLVTGYFGGAVATHVRLLQPAGVGPAVLGALAWIGLFLRDARLRSLLPLRSGGERARGRAWPGARKGTFNLRTRWACPAGRAPRRSAAARDRRASTGTRRA